ncbi:MAG: hypothetical protein JJU33_00660 [Phycisphaerales bacterium]|nr:hypothetical protein [Phycisphaerales bacterium]
MKNGSRRWSSWFGPAAALVCLAAVGLFTPVVQAMDDGSRYSAARAAERWIFGEGTLSANRTGYALPTRVFVVIGEPERQDARYESLLHAARKSEPVPASRVPEMLDGLKHAYLNHQMRTITITGEDGAEHRQHLSGPYQMTGSAVVTTSDAANDHAARSRLQIGLQGDHNSETITNALATPNRSVLVGVRVHGARMTSEERLDRAREFGPRPHDSVYPLVESRSGFLEDGQAMVVIGEYQSDTYGVPVRTIAVVECKRVLAEDLHYALLEFESDSDFGRLLSRFRTDAAMTEGAGFRDSLMLAAMDGRREGTLRVLSSGRARRGASGWEGSSMRSQGEVIRRFTPFAIARPEARGDPVLKLDLGLGEGPQERPIPKLTRTEVTSNGVPSWRGSLNGDLRVLLTGSDGDRHRAILCLHIGEYLLD